MTRSFAIDMPTSLATPLTRLADTIMGSISGVRPTATDSAKSSASSQLPLVKPLTHNRDHHKHEADGHPRDGVDAVLVALRDNQEEVT